MAAEKDFIDPRKIGKPIAQTVHEGFKDPAYRKNYMLYQVRSAIAAAVKSLRLLRGLTQKELARRAGVPQPQIARLESLEDERIPSLEQLVKIVAALDSRAFLEIVPPVQTQAKTRQVALV